MKKALLTTVAFGALLLNQAIASPMGGFGDGGVQLQTALNSITTAPLNASSVNVTTDDLPEGGDSYWQIGGSGGSVSTILIELAGFASTNKFGIYDRADPTKKVELFDGAATVGAQKLLSILANGSVVVNFVATGTVFAANNFGYYLDSSAQTAGGMFYSDTTLNADQTDHMVAYQGEGDIIQVPPFSAGPWGANEYALAWEDLAGGGDRNFTDMVVLVESVSPVPDGGATVAMFGLSMLGLGAVRRKLKA
jgi:hypothetical protein